MLSVYEADGCDPFDEYGQLQERLALHDTEDSPNITAQKLQF